jgi:hypothetical protein
LLDWLRTAGRAGRTPKRWRTTTTPDPAATLPTDLIDRDFSCAAREVSTRWCDDITYIHTSEGWLYLATVICAPTWSNTLSAMRSPHVKPCPSKRVSLRVIKQGGHRSLAERSFRPETPRRAVKSAHLFMQ